MHVFSSLCSHAATAGVFTWMRESLGGKLVPSFPRVAAARCLRFLSFVVIRSLVCVRTRYRNVRFTGSCMSLLYWQLPKLVKAGARVEAVEVVAGLVAAKVRTPGRCLRSGLRTGAVAAVPSTRRPESGTTPSGPGVGNGTWPISHFDGQTRYNANLVRPARAGTIETIRLQLGHSCSRRGT